VLWILAVAFWPRYPGAIKRLAWTVDELDMTPAVLIVSSQARSVDSGVGTYANMILRGLSQDGSTDVTVATWGDELSADRYPGFDWMDLGSKPRFDPSPGCFWTLGWRLAQHLQATGRKFDLVHFLDAREGHAFMRSPLREGCRVIGTVHDDYAALVSWRPTHYMGKAADPWRRFFFHRWQKRLERKCYLQFDHLMVNSRATLETVQREYALDRGRMTPISLTVEPDVGDIAIEQLAGAPNLVFSGGNFYRKGLDVCIRALPELVAEFPSLVLHVVGACHSASKIRRLVRRLGLSASVKFYGQVGPERMASMIGGADLFVMPSRTEALGLVYLEAFRAGVPVLAGSRGGVTEIVRDRISGVLVAPGSSESLADGVRMLLGSEELRRQVVQGGFDILSDRTPDRLVSETLAAYGLGLGEVGSSEPQSSPVGAR